MVNIKNSPTSIEMFVEAGDSTLAEKLTLLFETRLSPDLDPYTLVEVSEGTGGSISPTYLMNLRDGKFFQPEHE